MQGCVRSFSRVVAAAVVVLEFRSPNLVGVWKSSARDIRRAESASRFSVKWPPKRYGVALHF